MTTTMESMIKMILQTDKRGKWAGIVEEVEEVAEVKIVTKVARVEDIQEKVVVQFEMN